MTKMALRSWLLLCSLLPALLLSVCCTGYFSYVRHQQLALSFTGTAQQMAQTLALSSSALLQQQDLASVKGLLAQSHQQNSPYISNISLIFTDQRSALHTNALQFHADLHLPEPSLLPTTGQLQQQGKRLREGLQQIGQHHAPEDRGQHLAHNQEFLHTCPGSFCLAAP